MYDKINVAVLGPIPRDNITSYQGENFEKFGCAVYTAVCMSSLAGPGSKINVVSHVRKSDVSKVRNLLSDFPHVDVSHVTGDADQGAVIDLVYVDQNRRNETQTGFMNPILPDDIEHLMECDAFVFVPITDFEIPLETVRYIKSNSDGLIVFDAHGPTNGCSAHGERYHKFWVDRDRWLPHIDLLKMNLEEAQCSWFKGEYRSEELNAISELTMDQLPKFARHCLDRGVKALYVTLDQHGCAVYHLDDNGKMREHLVKRVLVEDVVDTTGCGDSFAGGLAFGYLKTRDFVKACQFGNCAGAQRCSSSELDVYKSLDETERQIAETYGD
ncbi:carbohydrate kinase family protein [Ruegeria sp. 2205SS24-7]|uniref:carbohydrate kinase family protein n=1 Tax=Ruegeria discodermiae TaxID=3064389 RepID=UPI0027412012|nr:carbohydrate kinase family protein [Ruegeria sp. 2205SS24-7]MDP5220228.1 carbohydrate kinase family protein [Ruegeria sp. 2205SS24-7]